MTNQITQRIFQGHPGHSCQQEVLPCGEKVTGEKYRSLGWLIKAFVVLFSTKKQQIKNKTKQKSKQITLNQGCITGSIELGQCM